MVGVLNVGMGYKKVLAAGMAGLGATIGGLILTGKLFAAFPLAGIGGFVITAPHISGDAFSLTPSLTQTDQQQGWPAAMISIASNLTLDKGFELEKNFNLTATPIGSAIPSADLQIFANGVYGSGLLLDSTGLQAKRVEFQNFNAAEQYATVGSTTTEHGVESSVTFNAGQVDPSKQLGLAAGHVDLLQAAINTDALKTNDLQLNNLRLQIVVGGQPTGTGQADGSFTYDDTYDSAAPSGDSTQMDANGVDTQGKDGSLPVNTTVPYSAN